LDPSPKLPSALVINQICKARIEKVLLIRDKISRLSNSVTLDSSIALLLEYAEVESPKIHNKIRATKKVELRSLMDPGALAEQAVSLNLKLMKWR